MAAGMRAAVRCLLMLQVLAASAFLASANRLGVSMHAGGGGKHSVELRGPRHALQLSEPQHHRNSPEHGGPCDLCERNWLFVLSAYRTGSTTALSMLSSIPGFEIGGEHNGVLVRLQYPSVCTGSNDGFLSFPPPLHFPPLTSLLLASNRLHSIIVFVLTSPLSLSPFPLPSPSPLPSPLASHPLFLSSPYPTLCFCPLLMPNSSFFMLGDPRKTHVLFGALLLRTATRVSNIQEAP